MFWLAKTIAGMFGFDLQKTQKWVAVGLIGLIGIFVLVFALWMRSCLTKTPKLDEAEINKGEQAVKEANDEELRKILVNSDVKEILKEDANSKAEAVNAINTSKQTWANANRDELQAEFNRRKGQ